MYHYAMKHHWSHLLYIDHGGLYFGTEIPIGRHLHPLTSPTSESEPSMANLIRTSKIIKEL